MRLEKADSQTQQRRCFRNRLSRDDGDVSQTASKVNLKGKTVIDVGCGSGILGLSALLLGAKRAVLVDFDAQAVAAARENAALNGLESSCVF